MKNLNFLALFALLTIMFLCTGCPSKERKPELDKPTPPTAPQPKIKPTVNVYIENSGSMDGYVYGQTEFKGAIRDLLVMLKYHYDEENIKIFFINDKPYPTASGTDLATFATNINAHWHIGDRKNSELNNIFKQVLDRTNNQTISILFSDYIYSIPNKGNTVGLLNDAKSLTKDAFQNKWKKDKVPLATTIVKMKSKFDGRYFPYTSDTDFFYILSSETDNHKKEFIVFDNKYGRGGFNFSKPCYTISKRPYYICVIGNQEVLNDFNKKIEMKTGKMEGYENKYVLSSEDAKSVYYSVLQSTYNKGRFKPDRKKSKKNYIHGIEDVHLQKSGGGCSRGKEEPLSFAVAVDFSNIQAEDDYLKNPVNYTIITNNFSIDSIISAEKNKIKPNDWNRIAAANPTHIIVMTAKTKAVSDISFVLKKQMPQWIKDSNTEDDTCKSKLENKTFGLYYWITGISEAYETIYPNNKYFFECSISISK